MRDPDYYGIRFHHIYHDYPTYHQHDFWEFFACLGGSYLHVVDGQKYVVNKFDACLLRPGVSHSMQDMVQGTSHFTIMISADLMKRTCDSIDPTYHDLLSSQPLLNLNLSNQRISRFLTYLDALRCDDEEETKRSVVSFLVLNILEVSFLQRFATKSIDKPRWLVDLIAELQKPANIGWTVQDVVKYSDFSHSHLSRLFKKEMGCSLIDYMNRNKMNYARSLLLYSDLSLIEITEELGYSSLSYFNNIFKRYYHCPPGKYRKECNKNNAD